MKNIGFLFVGILIAAQTGLAEPESSKPNSAQEKKGVAIVVPSPHEVTDSAKRAERRLDEMLGKMRASVEEIAQLYGNPVFLQVFTNDTDRANELKERLRAARSDEEIRRELADLEKRRDDLLNDIALRERESTQLASRLVRQRAALDSLAAAVEQARKAVEDTTK